MESGDKDAEESGTMTQKTQRYAEDAKEDKRKENKKIK